MRSPKTLPVLVLHPHLFEFVDFLVRERFARQRPVQPSSDESKTKHQQRRQREEEHVEIARQSAGIKLRQSREFQRGRRACRSEEHTYELQSLMRISYAVFCLTK